jgi:hypothetical protein
VDSLIGDIWVILLWILDGVVQLLFCHLEDTCLEVLNLVSFCLIQQLVQIKKYGFKVLVNLNEVALPAFREDMQMFASSQELLSESRI